MRCLCRGARKNGIMPASAAHGPRPWLLAEATWQEVRHTAYQLAVLPWGATEAHNFHLPYGTDNYQAEWLAEQAAARAWQEGARLIVLPGIPFGVNSGQLEIKLCMHLNPSTQLAILRDLAATLVRHGIEKLVIFNGHGGNDFLPMIRELSVEFPDLFVCSVDWYRALDAAEWFDEPGDHAGELETSLMMHVAPHLVRPLDEAGEGHARPWRIAAFREGWARGQRLWHRVTQDTGAGNPHKASAGKGRAYAEALIGRLAAFFVTLSQTPLDELWGP